MAMASICAGVSGAARVLPLLTAVTDGGQWLTRLRARMPRAARHVQWKADSSSSVSGTCFHERRASRRGSFTSGCCFFFESFRFLGIDLGAAAAAFRPLGGAAAEAAVVFLALGGMDRLSLQEGEILSPSHARKRCRRLRLCQAEGCRRRTQGQGGVKAG